MKKAEITMQVMPLNLRLVRKALSWRSLRAWREIQLLFLGSEVETLVLCRLERASTTKSPPDI